MRALSGGCAGEQIIIIEGSDLRSVRVTTGANGQKSQSSYAKGQKSQSSYAKGHMDDGRCILADCLGQVLHG